jgi:uncharacterized protein (DUF1501 family)
MSERKPASPAIHQGVSRRQALRFSAMTAAAGGPFLASLAGVGAAAAQQARDYKALVCVYLLGGNDDGNTIVPASGSAYADYARARPSLALAQNTLLPISPAGHAGAPLALSPQLVNVRNLFAQGRAAIMANVGTLNTPITKAEWRAGSRSTPFQLFSHSDQQGAWQTGLPDRVSRTGWLGRMGDIIAPRHNDPGALSIAMSVAGNNAMQVGQDTIQYQLTTRGAVRIAALHDWGLHGSPEATNAMRTLLTQSRDHMFENTYNQTNARAIASEARVSTALAGAPNLTTVFPTSHLGSQAKMVARMISAGQALGHKRQIFYIASGGWDFHDDLLNDHAARLADLDASLSALYAATVELGVANEVTTFTASEFGRALQSNGRGSDHGWGGHHFIIGGAVRGGRVYGTFPTVALGGPDDAGQGRLIPTTAVDQYAATLARWFGVAPGEMATVLPNIGRFATADLGFLA